MSKITNTKLKSSEMRNIKLRSDRRIKPATPEVGKKGEKGYKAAQPQKEYYVAVIKNSDFADGIVCGFFPAQAYDEIREGKIAEIDFTVSYRPVNKEDKEGNITVEEVPSLSFDGSITKAQMLGDAAYEAKMTYLASPEGAKAVGSLNLKELVEEAV